MIITISGLPGSGKSTAASLIAKKLNLKKYSMGDLRGKMAVERGLTIDEFNALPENTDDIADKYQKELGEKEDDFVIDGWISWNFIPESVKVFLTVDPRIAAERIFRARNDANRQDEPGYTSVDEVAKTISERVKHSDERYQRYYNIDFQDPSHYDFILDTSNLTLEEVVERIIKELPE